MMPESKEAPVIRLGKALAVFDGNVNSVVLAVEISSAGWFFTRAVWKSRIKNASQLFYDDRSFRKGTCLQVGLYILFLDVHMMVLRKVRASIVETCSSAVPTRHKSRAFDFPSD